MNPPAVGPHPHVSTLDAYRLGALGDARAAIELHLSQCAACRAHLASAPSPEVAFNRPAGSSSTETLARGAVIGRYIVLELLDKDATGEVYSAIDPELARKVAIKLVIAPLGAGQTGITAQTRLLREAQAMAKLSHPNVVGIYDVGIVHNRVFLAMEFVSGHTLTQWIDKTPRSWRDIVQVFNQAGLGLQAAHQVGLVHGDFKPDNVLIGTDGRVFLSNFGLARAATNIEFEERQFNSQPTDVLSDSGNQAAPVIGTSAFMAPELLEGQDADATSDQFAFAASLYRALYNVSPFEPTGGADTKVPAWVRTVVMRGLRANSAERHGSIGEFLSALKDDPAIRRRKHFVATAFAAAVLVLLGSGVVLYRHQSQRCTGAALKLEQPWSAMRQQSIGEAFSRAAPAYGSDVWQAVRATIDGYATRWVTQHQETCEATAIHGSQSEAVLSLRMKCLQDRLDELNVFTNNLVKADSTVVSAAPKAAEALTDLDQCKDVAALERRMPMPKNALVAKEIERLQHALREAASLFNLEQYQAARPLFESVAEKATALGYPPLEAEATKWLIRVNGNLGKLDTIRNLAIETIRLSELSGDDDNRFEGTLALCMINEFLSGKFSETLTYCDLAQSILPRTKDRAKFQARYRNFKGNLYADRSRFDEAMAEYQMGLEESESKQESLRDERETLLENVTHVLRAKNRPQEALARELEILESIRKRIGPTNASVAYSLTSISFCYSSLNDQENALRYNTLALEMRGKVLGVDTTLYADSLSSQAMILTKLGRFAESRVAIDQALAILDRGTEQHLSLPSALSVLGENLRRVGKPSQALPVFRRAHAMFVANGVQAPDPAAIGEAQTLFDLKRYELAELKFVEIIEAIERAQSQDLDLLSRTRFSLAQIRSARFGTTRSTLALAEQALKDLEGIEGNTTERKLAISLWLAAARGGR